MNLESYFERINYTGDTAPTLANLCRIHRAHLMAIPFENLNIHIPRPIILDETLLAEKIIEEQRGGFCFEQNGLFYRVLSALGYEVYRLEANVHRAGDDFGVRMGHMCLLVVIDGVRYLADVGFGASFIHPLMIGTEAIQTQITGQFRITFEGDTGYYYSQGLGESELSLRYRFYLTPHDLSDYEAACHYMQTSPDTHFTQKRVCSQWIDTGRITITEDKLIVTDWDGNRQETPITNEDHFHDLLKEHFGITVETVPPQVI